MAAAAAAAAGAPRGVRRCQRGLTAMALGSLWKRGTGREGHRVPRGDSSWGSPGARGSPALGAAVLGCQPCRTPHAGAPSSIPSPTVPPIHPQHSPSLLPQFPSAELRPPHHSPSPAYPPRGFSGGCCGVVLVAGPPPTPNLGSFCLYGLLIELCCGLPPPQATSSAFMPVTAFSCAGWAGVSRAVPRLHHPQHSFYFNFFFLINLFTHFGAFPLWVFF